MRNKFNAKMEWYPDNRTMALTPLGLDDYGISEIDGGDYVISGYKFDPSTGDFSITLKLAENSERRHDNA